MPLSLSLHLGVRVQGVHALRGHAAILGIQVVWGPVQASQPPSLYCQRPHHLLWLVNRELPNFLFIAFVYVAFIFWVVSPVFRPSFYALECGRMLKSPLDSFAASCSPGGSCASAATSRSSAGSSGASEHSSALVKSVASTFFPHFLVVALALITTLPWWQMVPCKHVSICTLSLLLSHSSSPVIIPTHPSHRSVRCPRSCAGLPGPFCSCGGGRRSPQLRWRASRRRSASGAGPTRPGPKRRARTEI